MNAFMKMFGFGVVDGKAAQVKNKDNLYDIEYRRLWDNLHSDANTISELIEYIETIERMMGLFLKGSKVYSQYEKTLNYLQMSMGKEYEEYEKI